MKKLFIAPLTRQGIHTFELNAQVKDEKGNLTYDPTRKVPVAFMETGEADADGFIPVSACLSQNTTHVLISREIQEPEKEETK